MQVKRDFEETHSSSEQSSGNLMSAAQLHLGQFGHVVSQVVSTQVITANT